MDIDLSTIVVSYEYLIHAERTPWYAMSYTDESVRAKLSTLNETQESIVTVAQWIMFHRYRRTVLLQIDLLKLITVEGTTQRRRRRSGYNV